jgi:hypothetical protein
MIAASFLRPSFDLNTAISCHLLPPRTVTRTAEQSDARSSNSAEERTRVGLLVRPLRVMPAQSICVYCPHSEQ